MQRSVAVKGEEENVCCVPASRRAKKKGKYARRSAKPRVNVPARETRAEPSREILEGDKQAVDERRCVRSVPRDLSYIALTKMETTYVSVDALRAGVRKKEG